MIFVLNKSVDTELVELFTELLMENIGLKNRNSLTFLYCGDMEKYMNVKK